MKAKMWKKANKWSCCLGLNLAGETTLQIVWPMCAWCAKWGFFEGAINGEVSECLNRWGERFWQPLFGVLHSALFTGLWCFTLVLFYRCIYLIHILCACCISCSNRMYSNTSKEIPHKSYDILKLINCI